MPPGRDWLDYATLGIAVVALALGIWNAWAGRSRVGIRLGGAFAPPSRLDEELKTSGVAEIYNPGAHSIELVEAGFSFRDGMRHVVGRHPATGSWRSLPYSLPGGQSFSISEDATELADQAESHANPLIYVWVRVADGRTTRKRIPRSWLSRYAAAARQRTGSRR
jgi:hypothetical protein